MEIQRRVLRYVWGFGKAWLRKEVVMMDVRRGGLSLLALGPRVMTIYIKQRYIWVGGGSGC